MDQTKKVSLIKVGGITAGIVLPIVVGLILFYTLPVFNTYHSSKPTNALSTTQSVTATPITTTILPTMSDTPTSSMPTGVTATSVPIGLQTYTSTSLGISFTYTATIGVDKFYTKETNDKIGIYNAKYNTVSNYVEVFTKSSSDTIQTAINKAVLSGYSTSDCKVNAIDTTKAFANSSTLPSTYEVAVIKRSDDPNQNSLESPDFASKINCPSTYAPIESRGYFMTDTNHPTKLLYIYLSQMAISGGMDNSKTWADTIAFQ